MNKGTFVVVRGTVVLEVQKENVKSIEPTPDGMAFYFKDGSYFQFDDPYMPQEAKQAVAAAQAHIRTNDNKTIKVDLNNKKHLVQILS